MKHLKADILHELQEYEQKAEMGKLDVKDLDMVYHLSKTYKKLHDIEMIAGKQDMGYNPATPMTY